MRGALGRTSFLVFAVVCFSAVGCGAPASSISPADPTSSSPSPHWSYAEANAWGDLSPAFATGRSGAARSPVKLTVDAATDAALRPLSVTTPPLPLRLLDTGHAIQVEAKGMESIEVGGEKYDLEQFHFHVPSEH